MPRPKIRGAQQNNRMMSGKPYDGNGYQPYITIRDCLEAGLQGHHLKLCATAALWH